MGCDIHFVIEKKVPNGDGGFYWLGLAEDGRMKLGQRNYPLFGELAGVRCDGTIRPDAKPNGVPDDASSLTKHHVNYWNGDGHSHGHVPLADALVLAGQVDLRCAKYTAERAEEQKNDELKARLRELAEKELKEAERLIRYPEGYIEGLTYREPSDSKHEYGTEEYLRETFADYRLVFWFDN